MKVESILAPVDFSDCSREAFAYAVRLAEPFGARVTALHVVSPPPYVPMDLMLWGPIEEPHLAQIRDGLRQFVASLRGKRAVEISIRVESGIVPEVILEAALQSDIVVVGTHGRSGIPHWVLGSVAERVVRFSERPVLTVPRSVSR